MNKRIIGLLLVTLSVIAGCKNVGSSNSDSSSTTDFIVSQASESSVSNLSLSSNKVYPALTTYSNIKASNSVADSSHTVDKSTYETFSSELQTISVVTHGAKGGKITQAYTGGNYYGNTQKLTILPPNGYRFGFMTINGIYYSNSNTSFIIQTTNNIDVYYLEENTYYVAILDQGYRLINSYFNLPTGSKVVYPTYPSIEGYDLTMAKDSLSLLDDMTEDVIIAPEYTKSGTATISYDGITAPSESVNYGDILSLDLGSPSSTDGLYNGTTYNGEVLTKETSFSFKVLEDCSLKTTFKNSPDLNAPFVTTVKQFSETDENYIFETLFNSTFLNQSSSGLVEFGIAGVSSTDIDSVSYSKLNRYPTHFIDKEGFYYSTSVKKNTDSYYCSYAVFRYINDIQAINRLYTSSFFTLTV